MKITNPITLDVARSNSYICLLAKQFDENSRFLIATLTNNGEPMIIPAGAAVTLRATRPDGEPVAVPGIINNDGTTTVEIDDYILEVVGSASLSIEVAIGDEILTSASFNLTIQRADGNGWLRVYVAAANLAAGNYYITIGDTPYAFTTTQAIPAGGSVYFASEGGTAQTRDADGNVLDASLPVSIASTGTELTSDVPTMSFLTAIAGRMATIEAEMSQKANIDGSYPLLHAGTADDLMTDNGATQAIPFIQEGTGKGNGEATVKAGGVLQLKKKLGNTVGVNQLVPDAHSIAAGTYNWKGIFGTSYSGKELIKDHYYLTFVDTPELVIRWRNESLGVIGANGRYVVYKPTTTDNHYYVQANGTLTSTAHLKWSDLTLWFGSNDRIPSDLLSHPENWGRYYAGSLDYAAGYLDSADGTVLTSKGADDTTVLAEVDTGSEVLRSALDVADEKAPDGTITRKVQNDVWNGTESWTFQSVNSHGIANFSTPASGIKSGVAVGLQSNRFLKQITTIADTTDEGILGSSNVIYLRIKSSTASTVAALKTYLASNPVSVNYELATPTTEQGTAFAENIPCDPDGTLNWTQSAGVPQGNEIFYPADLKGALESIVAALPSANGTYTLHATVTTAGVTFSWS